MIDKIPKYKALLILVIGLILPPKGFGDSLAGSSQEIVVPETIPGVTRVNADELIKLVQTLPSLIVIDARIRDDRLQGHIEGSISLPDVETNCISLKKIIPQYNVPVLFYCNGVKCGRSVKSSRIALACGYNNIYWFRGGFSEWQSNGYPYIAE